MPKNYTEDELNNGRWVTMNGAHIFIKNGETAEDAMNRALNKQPIKETFSNGDTPKSLSDTSYYTVKKIALDDSKDADYGSMIGSDAKLVLKGFHYEELFPGEGMWYSDKIKTYGFDVKLKKG